MAIIEKIFDEFLNALPTRVKELWLPILLLILLEAGTYSFFALFFYETLEKGAFRSVLTNFNWQILALSEFSLVIGITLFWYAKKQFTQKQRLRVALITVLAIVDFTLPGGFYLLFHPPVLREETVYIFYLDNPEQVRNFDKDLLIKLLKHSGRSINISFNWVDWSGWSPPKNFNQLDPLEQLDSLVTIYRQKNPGVDCKNAIGITSNRLDGNPFLIYIPIPGINLSVITVSDWESEFAPPTVYEYLLHTIILSTLRYRMSERGEIIPEHRIDDYNQVYFDKVIDKRGMRYIICNGHFNRDDENLIRKILGKDTFEAYDQILSLSWLKDEKLQKNPQFYPDCFK